MNSKNQNKVHPSFWLIGILMLSWNIMGCINFILQMTSPEMVSSFRETEQAIIHSRPAWATVAFALAVFGGALGCLLLLLRKACSYYLFIGSFIGVTITMIHTTRSGISFSIAEITGIIIMPLVVAGFLAWYSTYCRRRGWFIG